MTAPPSTAVVRQWARDNGLTVGDRGRLSPQLLDAFASAGGAMTPRGTTGAAAPALDRPVSPEAVLGAVRITVQPTPGAVGLARKIAARSE